MRFMAVLSAIRGTASIATLVVFGLLMIPVECSVAMGPHTIFVSADAVAALQDDAHESRVGRSMPAAPEHAAADAAATASRTTTHQGLGVSQSDRPAPNHHQDIAAHPPADDPAPDEAPASSRGAHVPARPAGISADAVVALDIPGGHPELLNSAHDVQLGFAFTIPPDRLPTGPEPPPP